ncbi:sushi domain-containing protein 1 isoform X2 [Cynoglossus semilaevis]|uniref:sushi domain-containing protein 1 isoform X2 n=1 Tax=Cynoglossus semilaevis TaxID=244447 RepID=UPI000D6262D4|nr:sushi domain-containing protein 1 isoform X2 [Cynoglossus semilaevis]
MAFLRGLALKANQERRMLVLFLLCASAGIPAAAGLDGCDNCHVHAICVNKSDNSGEVCICKYGFVGNGRTSCQDKNECQIGDMKICGQHTRCYNTYGSYHCTCLPGYSPSNNKASFIPNDGTNCQDIDECSLTGVCGEGGQCRNLDGTFECRCELGYRVHNGREPFNPKQDQASCRVVDCGRPVTADNTELLSITGTTYGSVAAFACDKGFIWAGGDNRSVCGAEGQWRGSPMVCEEVDCGSPPAFPHTRILWNKKSTVGTQVIYQCISGYHNVGKGNVSICDAAGQWEEPHVLCQVLCGDPPTLPQTGYVWNGSSTHGSTVSYFCKIGFYYSEGENVSLCTVNGSWTKPNILCKEVRCGAPPTIPHSVTLWNEIPTVGSQVIYECKTGYHSVGRRNISLCTATGEWDEATLLCQEIRCRDPIIKPHSKILWDGASRIGSVVFYQCEEGYRSRSLKNYSVCRDNGQWEDIDLWCEEISCGPPLILPHTNLVWDHTSRPGSLVLYECVGGFYQESGNNVSVCALSGEWVEVSMKCRAKCGPVPSLTNAQVVWYNSSVVAHRCVDGYHSWRGTNVSVCVWQEATMRCTKVKPPITHLHVFNEKCVQWRAEKYEEDTESYRIIYKGTRDFQWSFYDMRQQYLKSKAEQLKICLNLLPLTNYNISITALSARFTVTITINTTLPAPPVPVVYYREYDTPEPTLRLRRLASTLDLISSYQVFVLPIEDILVFDCSSHGGLDSTVKNKLSSEYIAAKISLKSVGTEVNFTVGDGHYYGGFYNSPLEKGRNYYIILRAVSHWRTALRSSCALWAKIRGTSYVLRVSSLCAAASVGLCALAIIGGYSFIWFFKKT